MASFNWLLWNQIFLFEELSGGDTWRREKVFCYGKVAKQLQEEERFWLQGSSGQREWRLAGAL